MRLRRGWVAGIALGAVVFVACGLEKPRDTANDTKDLSARGLDELSDDSIWSSLNDSERTAVERSGMSGLPDHAASSPDDEFGSMDADENESKADKASKLSMSVLVVAVSAAMA